MFKVKTFEELPRSEQGTCPGDAGPNTVIITASRPGEGEEPRHFFRRAIYVLKARKIRLDARKGALKAFALLDWGCMTALCLGAWSTRGDYDPLPDIRELQELARKRLGPVDYSNRPVVLFREALEGFVHVLETMTAAQRMSV